MKSMNDAKTLAEIGGLLIQIPVLLVCLVSILVAFVFWRRSPAASICALLGFGIALFLCILIPISQGMVMQMTKESGLEARATANIALGLVWSILRAISYILLLVGVYTGRKSTGDTPAG